MNNLSGKNHPNRVTCPKCGKPGTKKSRMIKRGKYSNGPYFYVSHRVGKKMKECYIGKNWGQPVDKGMPSAEDLELIGKNWPSGAHKNSVGVVA